LTKRNRKGFTLVEMMIVVLIIGILVAIALPNFLRARENARYRACVANMKQIQAAIEQWAMMTKAKETDTVESIDQLVTDGYLRSTPVCPGGGAYSITLSTGTGTGTVSNYTVYCSIHGTLEGAIANITSGAH